MSVKDRSPEEIRQEQIKAHCEMQNCIGCPNEFECDEAEAAREASEEEAAYSQYDGEDFDY